MRLVGKETKRIFTFDCVVGPESVIYVEIAQTAGGKSRCCSRSHGAPFKRVIWGGRRLPPSTKMAFIHSRGHHWCDYWRFLTPYSGDSDKRFSLALKNRAEGRCSIRRRTSPIKALAFSMVRNIRFTESNRGEQLSESFEVAHSQPDRSASVGTWSPLNASSCSVATSADCSSSLL